MTRLWLFNLDAEEELAALRAGIRWPLGGATSATRARSNAVDALHGHVADGGWLGHGDRVLSAEGAARRLDRDQEGGERVLVGLAWCPTPFAITRLEAQGATVEEPVDADILARANARETFADLDPLPQSCICDDELQVRAAVEREPTPRSPGNERAPAWLLRRSLVAAGRGRLVVEGWDQRAATWARSALLLGPVHVTPLVDVALEFALHGRVARDGDLRLGRPVTQRAAGGVYRSAEVADPGTLASTERMQMFAAAERVGQRLAEMRYSGPFGIDAFRWVDGRGRRQFHAPSEVNARFTMSFRIGADELAAG